MKPVYQYDQQPSTHFSGNSYAVIESIRNSEYSVLVGRNNCGKSYLLKTLTKAWGQQASYLGPARYQNFNLLGYYTPNRNRLSDKWQQVRQYMENEQQNIDNSPMNLQQAIAELSDDQRNTLSEIMDLLLGVKLDWRHTSENNSMSQQYISCNGHNISYTSSGFRLITTLVTSLLDTDYDTFLIDEPELGISPEAQGILADFLFDREHRAKYFPHIKTVVFATHSTIFLDRRRIANNYTVEKKGDEINVSPILSQIEFNNIHFFLLGNRFETLYLPSLIVLVEGKCDEKFVERVLNLRYPTSQISIIPANSDSRIKEILNIAKGLFSDLQRSPYRDRIFIMLDSVHSAGLPTQLATMGIPRDNIVIWPKNGIEYYYPPKVVDVIYGVGTELTIVGDLVSRNGISYVKSELLEKVLSYLKDDTEMHEEFDSRFLQLISKRLAL
jgi:predicted ATP-dependent endonuclease of OLD family